MILAHESHNTGNLMDLLIENHSHLLIATHLQLIHITDDINHIAGLRIGKLFQRLHFFRLLHLHAGKKKLLLVTEYFINSALRYMKTARDFIHLNRFYASFVKLSHGIVYDFISQLLSVLINFCHIYMSIYTLCRLFFVQRYKKK